MSAIKEPPAPELFTVKETASKLRLSYRSVQRHARSGRLPSVRMGKRLLIKADAVRHAIANGIALD